MEDLQTEIDEVLTIIDDRGNPKKMTKGEWIQFLEGLIEALEARRDAAKE